MNGILIVLSTTGIGLTVVSTVRLYSVIYNYFAPSATRNTSNYFKILQKNSSFTSASVEALYSGSIHNWEQFFNLEFVPIEDYLTFYDIIKDMTGKSYDESIALTFLSGSGHNNPCTLVPTLPPHHIDCHIYGS